MPGNKHSAVCANVAALSLSFLLFFGSILPTGCTYTPQPLRPFPAPKTAPAGIGEGMRCPNFVFQDEQTRIKELKDYRGKIIFVHFWASWCVHCQREMPSIQKLYDELKNEEGIVFLLLTAKKDFSETKRWAGTLGYDVPLALFNPSGGRAMINVRTLPRTLILDRNGIVVLSKTGDTHWVYWLERIRDLIKPSATIPQEQLSFPADGVRIKVDVTEGKPNSDLRLAVIPQKGVKLSARRGIVVTPVEGNSIRWVTAMPVTRINEDIDYFPDIPALTLSFLSSGKSAKAVLEIEYGYCRDNSDLCVPAKAVIEVPLQKQH